MMPIQTMVKEGFMELFKKIDPRYILPKKMTKFIIIVILCLGHITIPTVVKYLS